MIKKFSPKANSFIKPFEMETPEIILRGAEAYTHKLDNNIICLTDSRARPRSRFEIVLEATEGFIPLWDENLILKWNFNNLSLIKFKNPDDVADQVRNLVSEAIKAWGYAAPIRFVENGDNSDFEIFVEEHESCNPMGCTLAQAFFPDAGRHQLYIYPTMFKQVMEEQVDTLTHEIGHIFGLRHFFAPENETEWPSVVFGKHKPFSIMNYGKNSKLTDSDKEDLFLLYKGAWSGQLKNINGTPIKLVRPYHYSLP
ncbi:matrixin family metalloprotease [Variovorax sp. PvP013]|uniref:matrixin family metalloprotease n=1 Tax=Variovorax sp. PvP013 TaxID=3156435 RepID=UPI003D1A4F28